MKDEQEIVTTDAIPAPAEQQQDHMIPKARFDDVNQKLRALEKRIAADEAAREAQEETRLKEAHEFKTLYEKATAELATTKQRLEELVPQHEAGQQALETVWTARKTILPPAVLSLTEKLPLIERLTWLAENEGEFTRPAQGTPQHPRPTGGGKEISPFAGKVRVSL